MENYEIISPDRRVYATARTWNEAVDKATELSLLHWGSLFRVRRTFEANLPFQPERRKVLETSLAYIELARAYPKSISTEKAKVRFQTAKRKLDEMIVAYSELQGSDLMERRGLESPIKAYRTDTY